VGEQQSALRSGSDQWWLTDGDGMRVRIDAGGVLLGRSPRCEIVLRDPKASRAQALVYLEGDRPRLLILGKGRTQLNQRAAARETALATGDRLSVPGLDLQLISARVTAAQVDGPTWVLERPGGGLFGVATGPFVVGGHADDDLQLEGWPDHALALHPTQGRLHLSTQIDLEVDGAPLERGALVALAPGSSIVHAGHRLRVITSGQLELDNTLLTEDDPAPIALRQIALEFLPRGGRLRVHAADGERCVYLPGQRCDLMAVLLSPPEPHQVGEILDDDYLIERLWPNQTRTRGDLNTLVYRLRKDLVRAGIDATAFLLRTPGGGGTRLGLARGVAISIT
jgi:hypothetical protein